MRDDYTLLPLPKSDHLRHGYDAMPPPGARDYVLAFPAASNMNPGSIQADGLHSGLLKPQGNTQQPSPGPVRTLDQSHNTPSHSPVTNAMTQSQAQAPSQDQAKAPAPPHVQILGPRPPAGQSGTQNQGHAQLTSQGTPQNQVSAPGQVLAHVTPQHHFALDASPHHNQTALAHLPGLNVNISPVQNGQTMRAVGDNFPVTGSLAARLVEVLGDELEKHRSRSQRDGA